MTYDIESKGNRFAFYYYISAHVFPYVRDHVTLLFRGGQNCAVCVTDQRAFLLLVVNSPDEDINKQFVANHHYKLYSPYAIQQGSYVTERFNYHIDN